ncbi:MAG: SPOR domain-containing protein [Rhizobiales bacterium]|nr:SPOR domain-containing protein [Hyphomicrobiales bacterium]
MSMSDQIDQSARIADDSAEKTKTPEGANAPLDSANIPNDDPLADLIRLIQQEDPFKDEGTEPPSTPDVAEVQKVNLRPVEDERPLTLNEIEAAIEAATLPADNVSPKAPASVQDTIQQAVSEELGLAQNDFVPPVLEVNPPQKAVVAETVAPPADPALALEPGTYVDPAELAPLVEESRGVDPFDLDTALQEFRDSEMLNEQDFRNEQNAAQAQDANTATHIEPHFDPVPAEPSVEQPTAFVQAAIIPAAATVPVEAPVAPVQNAQADIPVAADPIEAAPSNDQLGSPYDDPAFEEYDQPGFQAETDFAVDPVAASAADAPRSRRGGVFAVGLLIGLFLIGGAMYFAFQPPSDPSSSGDVPFLRASQQPVKEIPENPGGEQIANQDRLVFNGEQSGADNNAERLVSREEPVGQVQRTEPKDDSRPASIGTTTQTAGQLPQAVTPPSAVTNVAAPVRATVPPPSATAAPQPRRVRTVVVLPDGTVVTNPTAAPTAPAPVAPVAVAPVAVANAPVSTIPLPQSRPAQVASANSGTTRVLAPTQSGVQTVPTAPTRVAAAPANAPVNLSPAPTVATTVPTAPTHQTVAVGPSPAPAPAPVIASASGEYVVQIAARRSEEQALGAFEQVKSQYASAIGNYRPLIQRADLGDRGVYYRLRVGPMSSQAEAAQVCNNLKAAGMGDCLVRER